MSDEMQEQAVPVHGRDLGWAKAAYQAAGVPIISIVALGSGAYAIVIATPTGAPAPDWRAMPTHRPRSWWERADWQRWAPVLLLLTAIAGVAWLVANTAPAALGGLPATGGPLVVVEAPDVFGGVQEAIGAAARVAAGVVALIVGLVVLWMLFRFRKPLGGLLGRMR